VPLAVVRIAIGCPTTGIKFALTVEKYAFVTYQADTRILFVLI
jgi:hypothetical protein